MNKRSSIPSGTKYAVYASAQGSGRGAEFDLYWIEWCDRWFGRPPWPLLHHLGSYVTAQAAEAAMHEIRVSAPTYFSPTGSRVE